MITLYDYFRSGAAYRTRIALNLKNLKYDQIPTEIINKYKLNKIQQNGYIYIEIRKVFSAVTGVPMAEHS